MVQKWSSSLPRLREEMPRVWAIHNLCWVVESNAPSIRRRRAAILHGACRDRPQAPCQCVLDGLASALLYMVGFGSFVAWVVLSNLNHFLGLALPWVV